MSPIVEPRGRRSGGKPRMEEGAAVLAIGAGIAAVCSIVVALVIFVNVRNRT